MLELRIESTGDLTGHAGIPSGFEAHSVFAVSERANGFELAECPLSMPFRKDYDSAENPLDWSVALEATRCLRVSAFVNGNRVGGVIAAVAAPGLVMWESRPDVAILWDLRVAPAYRRQFVATALLHAISGWARDAGCTELKVETQDSNPAACKLYLRSGFTLLHAQRGAYSEFPNELQLIWKKDLESEPDRPPNLGTFHVARLRSASR